MSYKCECGKEFKNQGGLNLHKSVHCKNKSVDKSEKKKGGAVHEHEFRFLVRTSPFELKAIQAGFKQVCEECLELE